MRAVCWHIARVLGVGSQRRIGTGDWLKLVVEVSAGRTLIAELGRHPSHHQRIPVLMHGAFVRRFCPRSLPTHVNLKQMVVEKHSLVRTQFADLDVHRPSRGVKLSASQIRTSRCGVHVGQTLELPGGVRIAAHRECNSPLHMRWRLRRD